MEPVLEARSEQTMDEDSTVWLRDLRTTGPAHDLALERLHQLLLRAARFEVSRRRPALPHVRSSELDEIALESAADALMSVLRRLDDFRGASRFTTWAYKFALLEAAVKLRKRAWQEREIPVEPEVWSLFASSDQGPGLAAEQAELVAAVAAAVETVLTAHQRQVLVALALDGVPIDVLADRLGSSRGALYKTLHDARRKLRAELALQGLTPETLLEEAT